MGIARVYTRSTPTIVTGTVPGTIDSISASFRTDVANAATPEVHTVNELSFEILKDSSSAIIPDSLLVSFAEDTYYDRAGTLFKDNDFKTGVGTISGSVNYSSGEMKITDWDGLLGDGVVKSLLTSADINSVDFITFRIPNVPIKSQSFSVRAIPEGSSTEIQITADVAGNIKGTGFTGFIDVETGIVNLFFGTEIVAAGNESENWYLASNVDVNGNIIRPEPVIGSSIKYNAVSTTTIPLSSAILGLNNVRLPVDGKVPTYDKGDVVVVLNDELISATYVNNQVVDLGRDRLAKLIVTDDAGNLLDVAKYTVDLDTGIITFLDLSGVAQPIKTTARIEDMAVVVDVTATGLVSLSEPVTHDYSVGDTLLCNAVIYSDLFANTSIPFDQQTWTGVWSDVLIGSDVLAQYNFSQNPIVVDNASCITERWALIFTNSTTFNIIGENVGVIGTGSTTALTSPLNPNTSQPYFTVEIAGWGAGWGAGNVLRFNTIGAGAPLWIIQAISQGTETSDDYRACIEFRGDHESH